MTSQPDPIATPPGTTLSTPSPTELHETNPLSDNMPPGSPTRALKHVYLIVATTPVTTSSGTRLGIGLKGSLPWPMIKPDMTYFRKVTTDGCDQHPTSPPNPAENMMNSVFMGRKTYESIPPKFRPLSNRRSHIITRSDPITLAERYRDELVSQSPNKFTSEDFQVLRTATPLPKMEDVIFLQPKQDTDAIVPITIVPSVTAAIDSTDISPYVGKSVETGLLICIGGAEIYSLLLKDASLRPRLRILQTEIQKVKEEEEFECDTFWPERLDGEGSGWREVGGDEVTGWTGVDVPQGGEEWKVVESVGVRLRVRGWVPGTAG